MRAWNALTCNVCGTVDDRGPHTMDNCLGVVKAQSDRYRERLEAVRTLLNERHDDLLRMETALKLIRSTSEDVTIADIAAGAIDDD